MIAYNFFDAHNHLADRQFDGSRKVVLSECAALGIVCVVNSTRPSDWPRVSELASTSASIIPTYGVHPWFALEGSKLALQQLRELLLDRTSTVGEIGLDYSRRDVDRVLQKSLFTAQLSIAAYLNRCVSIHCVKAWGDMMALLRGNDRPQCGFLLHSFKGPVDSIAPLARLGAYFSIAESNFPPNDENKEAMTRRLAVLRAIPGDRLLLETDATGDTSANGITGTVVPSSLVSLYHRVALLRGENREKMQHEINENAARLFGVIDQG